MKPNSPEFKAAVARLYNTMCTNMLDETRPHSNGDGSSRYRHAVLAFNEEILVREQTFGVPIWDLYEEALQMVTVDVKKGYSTPVASMEVFDHQSRDWTLMKIEQLASGEHPWRAKLRENEDFIVIISFGFGSVDATRDVTDGTEEVLALLPHVFMQLVKYEDEGEDGTVLDSESWNLQRDGIIVRPDVLKQFGRQEPDAE